MAFKDSGIVDVTFGDDVTVVRPVNLYGCTIGGDCFIGHGVMFINDRFKTGGPARYAPEHWQPTTIGITFASAPSLRDNTIPHRNLSFPYPFKVYPHSRYCL